MWYVRILSHHLQEILSLGLLVLFSAQHLGLWLGGCKSDNLSFINLPDENIGVVSVAVDTWTLQIHGRLNSSYFTNSWKSFAKLKLCIESLLSWCYVTLNCYWCMVSIIEFSRYMRCLRSILSLSFSSDFPWLSRDLNPGLMSLSLALYPLHHLSHRKHNP